MKSFRFSTFLAVVGTFVSLSGSALASNSAEVLFQGQATEEFSLDTVKYRTEYQNRPVVRTCYRREQHVVTRCRTLPNGRQQCWQEVVYGPSRPYPCTVIERVPVQVFDANVVARVKLNFGELPAGVSAHETFVAKLDEDSLRVSVKSSGKLLITQAAPSIAQTREGNTINVAGSYGFHFYDLASLSRTFENGIQNLMVKEGKIFFVLDSEFFTNGFNLGFIVSQNRALASDRVLYTHDLGPDLLNRTPTEDGRALYAASLKGLGVPALEKGKINFDLAGSFDTAGESILNARDLPNRGVIKAHIRMKAKNVGATPAMK